MRIRAPELEGRRWLNTGGEPLTLAALRGRFVLLDFWTFCCVNCLHVLDELRPLESEFGDVLTVIGVHSPKFPHEADPAAIAAAVERYEVDHPVLDDPELLTWTQYTARAWPTLVLVDPEGFIAAQYSGEGHGHALTALLAELVETHTARGTLQPGESPFRPPTAQPSTLRFPAKVVRLDDGSLLVADAGHHALTHLESDGETLRRRIGSGMRGLVDGAPDTARFSEPNGLCIVPDAVAQQVGYDVVVADTVNHSLRGVRLEDGRVRTVAGTGVQWMQGDPLPEAAFADTPLTSPWDVVWAPQWNEVAIAMAGNHQLWSFDPASGRVTVRGGTTQEGLVDGVLSDAWLAQPSGLAASADGQTLWFADAETSALRRVRNGVVHTEVGAGLFDFGHVDGPAAEALMQHPLGCCLLPDGSVAVADTYNGAIRRFDPDARSMSTLATGLSEPSGVLFVGGELLVVESAEHRLVRVRLPDEARVVRDDAMRSQRPPMLVRPGPLRLDVEFVPPPGQKLDDRYGPSVHLTVSSTPPELLLDGEGPDAALYRLLRVSDEVASGVLHISARAASCDDGDVEFPACHVHQQDWGVSVEVSADGENVLTLPLAAR
jgi:thiol-disulfide isomerase/thioredoxin